MITAQSNGAHDPSKPSSSANVSVWPDPEPMFPSTTWPQPAPPATGNWGLQPVLPATGGPPV